MFITLIQISHLFSPDDMHKIKYLFMFCVVVFVLTSIHL